MKRTKVVVKMGGSDKDVELSLHISKRETSCFDIKFDTTYCKESGLKEIVLRLFGNKPSKEGDFYIYHVVDVE